MSDSNDRPMDAVIALRDRGIDNPESLLEYADPEAIIRACEWWDGLTGVRTGLLVSKIRKGGIPEDQASPDGLTEKQRKLARLRAKFVEIAAVFIEGSVAEPHARMQARPNGSDKRHPPAEPDPGEVCPGDLIVVAVTDDVIEVRCDGCAFECGYTVRSAAALPDAPAAVGRDVPARSVARTADEMMRRRREDRGDDLRRLDPAKARAAVRAQLRDERENVGKSSESLEPLEQEKVAA